MWSTYLCDTLGVADCRGRCRWRRPMRVCPHRRSSIAKRSCLFRRLHHCTTCAIRLASRNINWECRLYPSPQRNLLRRRWFTRTSPFTSPYHLVWILYLFRYLLLPKNLWSDEDKGTMKRKSVEKPTNNRHFKLVRTKTKRGRGRVRKRRVHLHRALKRRGNTNARTERPDVNCVLCASSKSSRKTICCWLHNT